jgi:cytidylate kinase
LAPLPPVIAIDGPSASGKGTVAQRVAHVLGFHFLDSGALYRGVALAARQASIGVADEAGLARLAETLDICFESDNIYINQQIVTDFLRTEQIGEDASRVASLPAVRTALTGRQRAFRLAPGLVADGRDMGTAIFPDAVLKIYLTADPDERARRRYKQLIGKGISANMTALLQDILARDQRDSERAVAPLRRGEDAKFLDTTRLTVEAAVEQVLAYYQAVKPVS